MFENVGSRVRAVTFLGVLAMSTGSNLSAAEGNGTSCLILSALDVSALLGKDHDKPVAFGEEACRVESARPGRNIVLTATKKSPAEIKNWFAMVKKMNAEARTNEVAVVAEPALGPEAFSVREKGQMRGIELYAQKGGTALVIQADFASGDPISAAGITEFQKLMAGAFAKL